MTDNTDIDQLGEEIVRNELLADRVKQVSLYRQMLLIRTVEEMIADRYSEQKMRCPTHLSIGQEAVAVGVCSNLVSSDQVVSTHRPHAHYLAKGGDLNAMIAEIHGKKTGCSSGKGGSMHLVDTNAGFAGSTAIVGGTIPIAAGLALAMKIQKKTSIACAFFGDAAVEEGVFHETANFAVLKKLPVLFVCENNLYSVYSPLSVRQPEGRSIAGQASSYGMLAVQGDGNDVVDVYAKAGSAVQMIRAGSGPIFLEFSTYRWREHCGPNYDNDLGYRTAEEFAEWQSRDPVKTFGDKLQANGALSLADVDRMVTECREESNAAFKFAEESDFPGVEDLETHLFA